MKIFRNVFIFGLILVVLSLRPNNGKAQTELDSNYHIVGILTDLQNQPIGEVDIFALVNERIVGKAQSQADGRFVLQVGSEVEIKVLEIEVKRDHFADFSFLVESDNLSSLQETGSLILPTIVLDREITLGFWVATIIFVIVLGLIVLGKLHNTLAALLGVTLIFFASYIVHIFWKSVYIFDFERSLHYVDWNVIFLIMGMMMVIAVVEHTGIFQWLAFFAYRISSGNLLILLPILMLFTGVASAFLDNVTTMLLMTPITIQIALALDINPLSLLIPEVMASNVIGVSTLVGTPTNILIGSYGGISFNDFLINLTPGVLLAFIGLIIYCVYIFRNDLRGDGGVSKVMLQRLEERGKIIEPGNLNKAGWVGAGMIILFVLGEQIHLLPSVIALMGATILLLWIRPNIEEMIEAVDWTTLVFFIALFIVVGAVQEVGLITMIAVSIGKLVGDNLFLAMLAVTGLSALLSMLIANIPFTAAMLPVIGFLTATIPGADSKVLYFCLSVGAAMGGNGTLIGASANMVTAGIAEGAGYRITYMYFLKKGLPAVLITVSLAFIWLWIRF